MATERALHGAGLAFAAAVALHTADHLRRGQASITELLYLLGNLSLVLSVVTITLILTRHRLAPLFAAAVGIPLGLGFFTAHWLPRWSDMSDPVWEVSSWPALTYFASLAEIVTAFAVGLTGVALVRDRGLAWFAGDRSNAPVA